MEKHKPYGVYERFFKRPLDIICALLALTVFWWLYVIVAVLVRIKLGSPVIFKQARPGKNEKIFNLYKFRTMTDERDENGNLLPDEVRLTKFGRFLRKTSLDELPEAINILKGDMSVVGPRPLLISYLPYYTNEEKHRHDVRPGLSGWAQIQGRNFVGWNKRLTLDMEYVNKITFARDVSIVFNTFLQALKRENIAVNTSAIESNLAEERQRKQEQESA